MDNSYALFMACSLLIQHRNEKIALISGPRNISTSVERIQGYRDALEQYRLPFEERLIKYGDYTFESGYRAIMELEREGKSYTSETLEELRRRYPKAELWLLMGTDMFLTLHLWHDPEVITQLAGICAFGRTEQDGEELFAPQREFLSQKYQAQIVTITAGTGGCGPLPGCG